MSVSEKIRELARNGISTAEIARRLGIRYQHAYKVMKADGARVTPLRAAIESAEVALVRQKPPLTVDALIAGGFTLASRWLLSSAGDLVLDRPLPKHVGVYAFGKDGIILYVGVATMGLAKRLYFYAKPGVTQRTSQRLNIIIKSELLSVFCRRLYGNATRP